MSQLTPDTGEYPHPYGNDEKLPFDCGRGQQTFPILRDGTLYLGGEVGGEPDRVVFESDVKGNTLYVKFCGVMRHGPDRPFLNCPE